MGKVWNLQDAKNKFSEVADRAEAGDPQIVLRRGRNAVAVISFADYEKVKGLLVQPKTTFLEHLLAIPQAPEGDEEDPFPRLEWKMRDVDF